MNVTFVENQYYFKTYLQGESDLTKEEDRWDWDVENSAQPINKPNMEPAIEKSEVTATKDPTTKDPPSALQLETTIELDSHHSNQSECTNPPKTSSQLTTNAETCIEAVKTPTLRTYSRRKRIVVDSNASIINLESSNDNNASILIPNSFHSTFKIIT